MSVSKFRSSSSSSNSFVLASVPSSAADRCSSSSSSMAAAVFLPAVAALRPRALLRPRPRPLALLAFLAVVAEIDQTAVKRAPIGYLAHGDRQPIESLAGVASGYVPRTKRNALGGNLGKKALCFDSCCSRKRTEKVRNSLWKYEVAAIR